MCKCKLVSVYQSPAAKRRRGANRYRGFPVAQDGTKYAPAVPMVHPIVKAWILFYPIAAK